jgi:hypothetical protein
MTVSKLIKQLEKLRAKHGNVQVCVDRDDIQKALNGVGNIVQLNFATAVYVTKCDGDGFMEENRDGSERGGMCIVLADNNYWVDERLYPGGTP